jgi:hypothetical protein
MATKMKRIEDMSEEELIERSGKAYDKAITYPESMPVKKHKDGSISGGLPPFKKDTSISGSLPPLKKDTSISGGLPPLKRNSETEMPRVDEMGNAYQKGGKVSSASKRADGCATKGKTRGKVL